MIFLVAGAGGFIGGHMVKHLLEAGETVRAVDKKPIPEWYQRFDEAENICMDLSVERNAKNAVKNVSMVYNFAADMGGMGFIENFRIECMRSVLINTHLLESAYNAGVSKYFYASSACVYNTDLQQDENITALKESDAYPAMAERGYGWEKLYSEMMCQEYWAERKMKTYIARFHNVYGPNGSWIGGREKAPAAITRKVIDAAFSGKHEIEIWGDGNQTRSFMWIDDCITGIRKIVKKDELIATPINLGSHELVSINELVSIVEKISGITLKRTYKLDAPRGVAGRNSDNTFIQEVLGWEPTTPLEDGMAITYEWIRGEYERFNNKI